MGIQAAFLLSQVRPRQSLQASHQRLLSDLNPHYSGVLTVKPITIGCLIIKGTTRTKAKLDFATFELRYRRTLYGISLELLKEDRRYLGSCSCSKPGSRHCAPH